MKLKMPDPNEIITISGNPDRALKAKNKTTSLALDLLSEALAAKELTSLRATIDQDDIILDKRLESASFKPVDNIVKFQVHPTDPNKTSSVAA